MENNKLITSRLEQMMLRLFKSTLKGKKVTSVTVTICFNKRHNLIFNPPSINSDQLEINPVITIKILK